MCTYCIQGNKIHVKIRKGSIELGMLFLFAPYHMTGGIGRCPLGEARAVR